MMIRTAGGPGLVSPIDYGERRKPLSRNAWIAIGIVAAGHVAVGIALYNQNFVMEAQAPTPEGPIVTVDMVRPVIPPKTVISPEPPAPTTRLNPTPAPQIETETLAAVVDDAATLNPGPLISVAADPVPPETATGTATEPVQPPKPSVITNPRWASRPTGDQLMRAYPQRAITNGVTGVASLNCAVSAAGSLSDCRVVTETPRGQGFGRAATGLSRYFSMSPRTVDGQAVDGARVAFDIRFNLAD